MRYTAMFISSSYFVHDDDNNKVIADNRLRPDASEKLSLPQRLIFNSTKYSIMLCFILLHRYHYMKIIIHKVDVLHVRLTELHATHQKLPELFAPSA